MANGPEVKYIACNYDQLESIGLVSGRIIAVRDRSLCFYDMETYDNIPLTDADGNIMTDEDGKTLYRSKIVRRSVSGIKVATKLPEIMEDEYADKLILEDNIYMIIPGDASDNSTLPGLYVWSESVQNYICIASVNVDEKVKTTPITEDDEGRNYYLVGTTVKNEESVGTLVFRSGTYIGSDGILHIEKDKIIDGKIKQSENADKAAEADKADSDAEGQNIASTYIKGVEINGTTITFKYGNNKEFDKEIPDTHYETNIVVSNTEKGTENTAGDNGNVYVNVFDKTSENTKVQRSSHKLTGQGATSVESDSEGNIVVKSENTWKANSKTNDGYVTKGGGNADKIWGTDDQGNPGWQDKVGHPDSNVVPGKYTQVTVDGLGHVTEGHNPTTLKGYGILDATPQYILDDKADLDDVVEPGFYVAKPENSIKNKPEGVNSFGLEVIKASTNLGYITQKLYGSGEPFIERESIATDLLSSPTWNGKYVVIKLSTADYPETLVTLGNLVETYNFLDNIFIYTDESVLTLREACKGIITAQFTGENYELRVPTTDKIHQSSTKISTLPETTFPSYEYCSGSSEVKIGYLYADGVTINHYRDETHHIGVAPFEWSNITNEFTSDSYSYETTSATIIELPSIQQHEDDDEPGVRVTGGVAVESVSVNGETEGVAYFDGGDAGAYVYLRVLTNYINDVRLTCVDGKVYQVFIKNESGYAPVEPSGDGSSEEYARRCINKDWKAWKTTSIVSWVDYTP